MEYFTFKSIDSREMGVEIETMPPITKPPKKHNLIEIAGRDETLIEALGYSAYMKNVQIGIPDVSRIDEIIAWLDGSGDLGFSNEEYIYNATVVGQIDYESALIYRRATVPFLVQPFKYRDYTVTEESSVSSFTVFNLGNIPCEPIIKIYGSGTMTISINGVLTCTLTAVDGYITVDSAKKSTYKDNVLKNRTKTGSFPILQPGANIVTIGGNFVHVEVVKNERWL